MSYVKIGVAGPVGSGKTALIEALSRKMAKDYSIGVITNDIYTKEDAQFLAKNSVLPVERIIGVETGGCPHTAIREDASMNLEAVDEMMERFPDIELLFIESGGDNLSATFSPELVDATIFVIDVAEGDKIPRKGGPGITRSDLLVINKIDLPSAHPDEVKTEIEDDLAIPADDAVCVSGKTGEGIHDLLESIVFLISPPKGDANAPLKALILDSYFDEYRGVVATVRVFDGSIKKGDTLRMMQAKGDFLVDGVGVKRPAETPVDALTVGEVGYVVTGLKDPEAVRVGDTLTWASNPCPEPLPGYREAKPMVYTGLFPIDNKDYENLRDALDKLHVNDPSLVWEPETSVALGFGCIWRSSRSAWSASSTWT